MALNTITDESGVVVWQADTVAKTVTTLDETRPMDEAESAAADAQNAAERAAKNEGDINDALDKALGTLKAVITDGAGDAAGTQSMKAIRNQTNADINSGPAPYVKALAGAIIDIARSERHIIRATRRSFDVGATDI